MTVSAPSSPGQPALPPRSRLWLFLDSLPGARQLKNFSIGVRLIIGFGILVIVALLGAAFAYLGSIPATETINRTNDIRVPTALASTRAQADLLRMLSDVRGYLALGEPEFRSSYNQSQQALEADLAELNRLSVYFSSDNKSRLAQLQTAFEEWKKLPGTLFELRDDQFEREPAYRLLATDGSLSAGNVLIGIGELIDVQGRREATSENLELLRDMAKFQGSFGSMFSALRGYVTTRNRIFRQEYEGNLTINEEVWGTILRKRNLLSQSQQTLLDNIEQNRQQFLQLPQQMFEMLESERWREDLYLFKTEVIPLTEQMEKLLDEITIDQQGQLQNEVSLGRAGLTRANRQTLAGGLIAVVLGVVLTFIFRENIAGPVRRLTGVAEQIRGGDLEARAQVEARDEIGTLAETFNNMTGQLRQTLFQVRKEKKRADDLLNVVIPIGVELSSEKNFNRLLENMLVQAKSFCHANAGVLYLREGSYLKYTIVRNTTQNIALGGTTNQAVTLPPIPLYEADGKINEKNIVVQTALKGNSINIINAAEAKEFDLSIPKELQFNLKNGGHVTTVLNIPLKNSANEVLGVMQLLDAQDVETNQVIPFDANIQQMMESFSSLASAALEAYIRESSLRREIQQLRIEIDEAKRQQQVSEIVDTDFFQDLQAKARSIRSRGRRSARTESETPESDS
jgi:methyl-accepting chemotaxis protein